MPASDEVRLRHILDGARDALNFTKPSSRQDLDTDPKLLLALTRLLEVIGEAARGVSPATRSAHPEFPWDEMIGMRDRLIHGYYDVNKDIIWETVTKDLPPLIAQAESLLKSLEKQR